MASQATISMLIGELDAVDDVYEDIESILTIEKGINEGTVYPENKAEWNRLAERLSDSYNKVAKLLSVFP